VRLIFQRLARWEYNRLANVSDGAQPVADGTRIANVLFSEFGEAIASLVKDKRAVTRAASSITRRMTPEYPRTASSLPGRLTIRQFKAQGALKPWRWRAPPMAA
jgi:hypothetical protein